MPVLIVLLGCAEPINEASLSFSDAEKSLIAARRWQAPVPTDPTNQWANSEAAATLGQSLFFEPGLSVSGDIACSTCHDPAYGFSDGLSFSVALGETRRHAPHLFNVGFQRWFYWDGRRDTLWGQALVPLENDIEMGSDRISVLKFIASEDTYRTQFEALFGALPIALLDTVGGSAKPVPGDETDERHLRWMTLTDPQKLTVNEAFSNVGKAIAAYEMTLVTDQTPFDIFVDGLMSKNIGRMGVLSKSAQRGLKLFMGQANCHLCHTGPLFSDREFHYLGFDGFDLGRSEGIPLAQANIFSSAGPFSDAPNGEKAAYLNAVVAGHPTDGAMKTPSLRNIALSPPFMHDGRFATLHDVVDFYNKLPPAPPLADREFFMKPLGLNDTQVDDLVNFLRALTENNVSPNSP